MKVKKSILKQIQRNVFLGLGIYLILIFAGIYVAFKWTYHKEVKSSLEGIKASLKESILLQGDSNFKEALLFAENQDVKRIYLSLKKEGGDLSRVEEKNKEIFQKYGRLLRDTTEPLIKVLERETGVRPKIHFHLPGPRSFVRTWKKTGEDVKLDDLSGFRFAITEAQKSKTYSWA